MMRRIRFVPLVVLLSVAAWCQQRALPNKKDSLKFAIIGDSGTGDREAYDVAHTVTGYRKTFPFEFIIMLGDNLYGGEKPKDFERKFANPYKDLLDAGLKFYAALGNHDDPNQRHYKHFNMGGERYYTFKPRNGVRFFALDSNYMDKAQLEWLEKELRGSQSDWKIAFFHHPLYSSGEKHGSDLELRAVLEPVFVKYGVSVVFAGHEHFYERIKPQRGIQYFVSGAAAKLRRGGIRKDELYAKGFDEDRSFMLAEIAGNELYFQTISRTGDTVDSGSLRRRATLISKDEDASHRSGASEVVGQAKFRPRDLPRAGLPAQLRNHLVDHTYAAGADRVPARF